MSGLKAALLLGGLYDLKPLQSSFLKPEIGITDEEVERFTPLTHRYDPTVAATILVGELETTPFHAQAGAFAEHLADQGLPVKYRFLPRAHHMSSVRDLGDASSDAGNYLFDLIRSH
jgi:arylformamidase